jgi:hypothetical protein
MMTGKNRGDPAFCHLHDFPLRLGDPVGVAGGVMLLGGTSPHENLRTRKPLYG